MKWFRANSLSVVFAAFFLISLCGQVLTGMKEHNEEMAQDGGRAVGLGAYLKSGHFLQATFENWESEFFQMALFVILTRCLYQQGSSESKDPDKDEEVDRQPDPTKKDAPWPVRRGGFALKVYKSSLSIAFTVLFLLSFGLHFNGSMRDYNEEQSLRSFPTETAFQYLGNSRFWFESFQNWQSEFLSVLGIVVLSIFLRQQGSAQSKPVDAPDSQTGV